MEQLLKLAIPNKGVKMVQFGEMTSEGYRIIDFEYEKNKAATIKVFVDSLKNTEELILAAEMCGISDEQIDRTIKTFYNNMAYLHKKEFRTFETCLCLYLEDVSSSKKVISPTLRRLLNNISLSRFDRCEEIKVFLSKDQG